MSDTHNISISSETELCRLDLKYHGIIDTFSLEINYFHTLFLGT